jgi:hypothetical protein
VNIGDNKEAASTALHNILTLKSREITGISPQAPAQTPPAQIDTAEDHSED